MLCSFLLPKYMNDRKHANVAKENEQNHARCAAASYPYCSYDANGDSLVGCYEKKIPSPGRSSCEFNSEDPPETMGQPLYIFLWVVVTVVILVLCYGWVSYELGDHWGPGNVPEEYSHV
jgi:hypothetical protein